ncbi:dTDP-4-dehydrorhamnose reductase [Gordonia shandongensis]|uniref:dTDP-4-dehydrorhamnose reductase n=1 Tax=Gordonia shandongensis TaxID=376351 RepID=UPI0003FA917F|nr:dTDP-4-dehydrorhamnose reductase [Gordonia shandongensis]
MGTTTVYLVGAAGQLGTALTASAGDRPIVSLTSEDVDVADAASVRRALADLRTGDVVINAAAYTAVDAAQSHAARAFAVNADGPENLARTAADAGARLVHVSTDYVFSAAAARARRPLEPDDETGEPETVYGASKLAGERAATAAAPDSVIVRTAWVFTGTEGASDFVATMRRLESDRDHVRVVVDQVGSPTYAPDLADGLWRLVDRIDSGPLRSGAVLHATNAGHTTWNGLARAVFEELGADPDRVRPCSSDEFPRPAPRPEYSVLSGDAWAAVGLPPLRPWRDAVHRAVTTGSAPGGPTDTLSR